MTAEYNAGSGGKISLWPETVGLAATFAPSIVKRFGEIAAKEYRALGITTALSPQIDLATEPRWSRFNGTFGEDPLLATDMARAYVDGFQTSTGTDEIKNGWGYTSVNTMVKHWPGGGSGRGTEQGVRDRDARRTVFRQGPPAGQRRSLGTADRKESGTRRALSLRPSRLNGCAIPQGMRFRTERGEGPSCCKA